MTIKDYKKFRIFISKMSSQECKVYIGSEPFSMLRCPPNSPQESDGGKGSMKLVQPVDEFTYNALSGLPEAYDSLRCEKYFQPVIGSSPDPGLQRRMSIKMKHPSPVPDSNSEPDLANEIPRLTGLSLNSRLRREIWETSHQTFTYGKGLLNIVIIARSALSLRTIANQLERSRKFLFTGVVLGPVSHGERGKNAAWMLTLKIPGQSGGTDIVVNRTLSSMNFGVLLTYPIYYDGSTDILSVWKSKAEPDLYLPLSFGLLPT